MSRNHPKAKNKPGQGQTVCLCHFVAQSKIEEAVRNGAHTLPEIFDTTTAGVGPCGGSCRPYLQRMLDSYLETGEFPESPRPSRKRRR